MGHTAERTQAATAHSQAFAVPASVSHEFAQDVVALALVAIAASSLLWRMARSVRGFLAAGRPGIPGDPTAAGSGGGIGAWSGGCGGGCSGCSSNAVRAAAPTTSIVSITGLTPQKIDSEPHRSHYSTQ
jgi:hypothetical protein